MELSSLLQFAGNWLSEALLWTVACSAAVVGLVAVVSALDMFFTEAG